MISSCVLNVSIERVWGDIVSMAFLRGVTNIATVEMEGGAPPTRLGSIRVIKHSDGKVERSRLAEISANRFAMTSHVLEGTEAVRVATIALKRVTENDSTVLVWSEGPYSKAELTTLTDDLHAKLQEIKRIVQTNHGVYGKLVHRPSEEDLTELLMRNLGDD